MDLGILLEQLGEGAIYILSNGLFSAIHDERDDLIELLTGQVCTSDVITKAMEKLVFIRTIREQYDELAGALDKYAYPKED